MLNLMPLHGRGPAGTVALSREGTQSSSSIVLRSCRFCLTMVRCLRSSTWIRTNCCWQRWRQTISSAMPSTSPVRARAHHEGSCVADPVRRKRARTRQQSLCRPHGTSPTRHRTSGPRTAGPDERSAAPQPATEARTGSRVAYHSGRRGQPQSRHTQLPHAASTE